MAEGEDGSTGDPWWETADIHENARRTARSMDEILNQGEVAAVEEYHREDLAYFRSSDEQEGRAGLKDDVRMFLTAFPDMTTTVQDVFADGDGTHVSLRYTVEGTHTGTFENIPPTGRDMTASGIGIVVYDGAKIGEFSLVFDNLGMLRDLGLIE